VGSNPTSPILFPAKGSFVGQSSNDGLPLAFFTRNSDGPGHRFNRAAAAKFGICVRLPPTMRFLLPSEGFPMAVFKQCHRAEEEVNLQPGDKHVSIRIQPSAV
jgi:hypothetical protein